MPEAPARGGLSVAAPPQPVASDYCIGLTDHRVQPAQLKNRRGLSPFPEHCNMPGLDRVAPDPETSAIPLGSSFLYTLFVHRAAYDLPVLGNHTGGVNDELAEVEVLA